MRRASSLAHMVILVITMSALAPAGPAAAQWLDPGETRFWAASGVALLTSWTLDGQLRRAEPGDGYGLPGLLASLGYRLGGEEVLVPGFIAATGLTYLTGWPTDGPRMLRVFTGTAATGVAVEAIKTTVNRGRPREVGDPREFRSLTFTRDNAWLAFPSGHSAAAFAVAAALDEEFDLGHFRLVGYGLATVVGWSRHYHDAHWASDTVAGAVLGIATARTTVAFLKGLTDRSQPQVHLGIMAGAPVLAVSIPAR